MSSNFPHQVKVFHLPCTVSTCNSEYYVSLLHAFLFFGKKLEHSCVGAVAVVSKNRRTSLQQGKLPLHLKNVL